MNRPEWIQELRQKASACVEVWYTADSWPINEIFIEAASPDRILELLSLLDSQQSKLEEMEKEVARLKGQLTEEIKIVSRVWNALGVSTYADAHGKEISEIVSEKVARVKELESQIEAAKVEGFNEGVDKCQRIVFQETGTNCSRTYGRIEKLRVADSKRGEE